MSKRSGSLWLVRLIAAAAVGAAGACFGEDLKDLFADRGVTTSESGDASANNAQATLEANEPLHAGKIGGHSMWISWLAPADGVVTFDTTGSTFDTLLAVYILGPDTNLPPMLRLRGVVANDDNGALKSSLVQFGATAGTRYEIAVDGYEGATGNIELNWALARSTQPPPTLVSVPADRSIQPGDTLTLTVGFQAGTSVKLEWYFNGQEIADAESATLVIPNFQAANVGRYRLRFTAEDNKFFTEPIEVQINSEGATNVLARDKVQDAPDSELEGGDDERPPMRIAQGTAGARRRLMGVVRGYSGTQIFNTTFATSDPNEPQHCNVPGGASYWFGYEPPTNGTARLDTEGSQFDTVLAVYSYVPPLTNYQGLIAVACDNNSGSNGLTSRLEFAADRLKSYLIVVDGVNGARGIAYLNYQLIPPLNTNLAAPIISLDPQSRAVALGSTVSFNVLAKGALPIDFAWRRDGDTLAGQTNSSLMLSNVQPADAGSYSVMLSNVFGSVTSAVATLSVISPPAIVTNPLPQNLYLGTDGLLSIIATGTAPLHYTWNKNGVPLTNLDAATLSLPRVALSDAGAYSVQVFNLAGFALSATADLSILGPASVDFGPGASGPTISFPTAGQANFVLEFTDQLSPPVWQPWSGPLSTNNGLISLTTAPHTNAGRFFRVRLP